MTKRPFTSRIEVFDVVACSFLFFVEIGLVFSVPHRGYKIEKNALDGCPGIEKEGRFQRRKAMGRYPKGREINRDPVSSGERERIGGLKKNKHEASPYQSSNLFQSLSKVFTSFSPGFIRFVVDWMMEKPASPLTFYLVKGAVNCNCEKVGRSGQRRGERPTKIGYSWFSAKSISVERMMSMARDPKSRGKQPRSYAKVPKQSLSGKGSDRAMTTRRAQVIHRSDETLKAAFSSVSSGTFCQSGKQRRAAKLVWKNCCAAGNPSLYKFSDEVFEQNFDRREVRMKQKQREMEKAKEPMRPSVVPCGVEGAKDLAGVFEKDLHLGCSLLTLGQLIGKPTDRATKRPTEREDHWEEMGAVDQVDGFVKRFFLDNFSLLVLNGNFLAISEAQGSRGKKARQKGGSPTPERCMKETLESYRSGQESAASYDKALAAV
ncbi:hypothetical protein V6N11_014088 [Hibiscus sabdariffa]|uniref:Uncharacterized protein n=1 Tax=Hibiscus sabdariffa TaxID=183260 RepID=A0ABR2AGL3_9ROSI